MGFNADDEVVLEYLAECQEHLATIETDLLAIESRGADIDTDLVNRVFRAAHSIKGGAGFFDLAQIRELAHRTENVLDMIRSRRMTPTPEIVSVLLMAFDKLGELIQCYKTSNLADISGVAELLTRLVTDHALATQEHSQEAEVSPAESVVEAPTPVIASPPEEPVRSEAPAPPPIAPPVPRPPAPTPVPRPAAPADVATPATEATIRLNVTLLDSLMTLAGELVLSRNQLNESLARRDERGIRSSAQRVSLVTSELQEIVSLTRMQPVGSVFSKFPRLVRDLAHDLEKEVQLKIEGAEVELDKTILEGLSDPLTHMVRNSLDHGIEKPQVRLGRGKPRTGTVTLRASHQAGQVIIEVLDDGKGLDSDKIAESARARGLITREQLLVMSTREKLALILLPGVSIAGSVSDISGRGVGMDVVKINLEKLGGNLDIDSTPGRGASFRIKLPLTLAIIPSLLISGGGERFAIPQVNVGELIRIPANQIAQRIDRVGNAEVLILRDRLVPLLHLSETLGLGRGDMDGRVWNVVLVETGTFEYGLVVDELHDTVEIVVKPLGRHLKGLPEYAGATILGDGRVAVILDIAGVAARAGLTAATAQAVSQKEGTETTAGAEMYSLLLFHNAPDEVCAVPIYVVTRIEHVRPSQIEFVGGRRTMQYRHASLPVIALSDVASVGQVQENQKWLVLVFEHGGQSFGLLGAEPLDTIETTLQMDRQTLRQRGIAASAVLKNRTTLIVDVRELVEGTQPEQAGQDLAAGQEPPSSVGPAILLAEDSDFFRGQLTHLIEGTGCTVLAGEDGEAAWDLLDQSNGEVRLVVTDIEMPRMDGLALTRRIRADERFSHLPVIAVSTLAGDDEIARGLAAGVTEYQVKLNKEELVRSIQTLLSMNALVDQGKSGRRKNHDEAVYEHENRKEADSSVVQRSWTGNLRNGAGDRGAVCNPWRG